MPFDYGTFTGSAPHVVRVTSSEAEQILDLATTIHRFDSVRDTEAYIHAAQLQAAGLPAHLRDALINFRRFGNAGGGLLIRGLAVGPLPPTPALASDANGVSLIGAAVLSLVVATAGEQFGFKQELGGKIVQDILPVKGDEDTQLSVSSTTALLKHVEMAFNEYRADIVALFCIRQDHDRRAGTTLSSMRDILPTLSQETVSILREPRFTTSVDESFLRGGGLNDAVYRGPIAALSGPLDDPCVRVDFAETLGLDPGAIGALAELADAVTAIESEARLAPGDLMLIDNDHAFHGRTPFKARWDGEDRWLLRTFVTRDLGRSVDVRPNNERIVDTDYSVGPGVMSTESVAVAAK